MPTIDPPWRLDPLQTITNVHWSGGTHPAFWSIIHAWSFADGTSLPAFWVDAPPGTPAFQTGIAAQIAIGYSLITDVAVINGIRTSFYFAGNEANSALYSKTSFPSGTGTIIVNDFIYWWIDSHGNHGTYPNP